MKPFLIVLTIFAVLFAVAYIEMVTDPNLDKPYPFQPEPMDTGPSAWGR